MIHMKQVCKESRVAQNLLTRWSWEPRAVLKTLLFDCPSGQLFLFDNFLGKILCSLCCISRLGYQEKYISTIPGVFY